MNTKSNYSRGFLLTAIAVLLTQFALIGCNTMQGVGKDIERAGEEIQEEAR